MTNDHQNCRCWKCFIQDNFTSIALLFIVVLGLILMVGMMHEDSVSDKYVTWFEGFVAGAFSAWTLALKSAVDKPRELPPGTVEQLTTRSTLQKVEQEAAPSSTEGPKP